MRFHYKHAGAVGLYVPGGTAVLPSTALMLAVPAGIAGCKCDTIVVVPSLPNMHTQQDHRVGHPTPR